MYGCYLREVAQQQADGGEPAKQMIGEGAVGRQRVGRQGGRLGLEQKN